MTSQLIEYGMNYFVDCLQPIAGVHMVVAGAPMVTAVSQRVGSVTAKTTAKICPTKIHITAVRKPHSIG